LTELRWGFLGFVPQQDRYLYATIVPIVAWKLYNFQNRCFRF